MSEKSNQRWLGGYVMKLSTIAVAGGLAGLAACGTAAGDTCTGATQYYTGTDTVQNGIIVAANVTQTG